MQPASTRPSWTGTCPRTPNTRTPSRSSRSWRAGSPRLEVQLRNAAVIEKTNGDSVGIGSKVVIKGAEGEETFTIVGSAEAAPRDGRISNESPVGKALMGRKKGDTVTVQAPAGPIEYTLVRIG